MTDFESIARLRLVVDNDQHRRPAERNRFAEGVAFLVGLWLAIGAVWCAAVLLLSLG